MHPLGATFLSNGDVVLPQREAEHLLISMLEHLGTWPIKSAEAFRNCALGDGMLALNPLLNFTEDQEVEYIKNMLRTTVAEGRMIDFGHIPNEVLIAESKRAREVFESNEFNHPFDTWLGVTSWEGGYNGYHVSVNPSNRFEVLVVEIYGLTIPTWIDALLVYDITSISVEGGISKTMLSPATMKWTNGHIETEDELRKRASNCLDPLVTMLRFLADASIPIAHVEAPMRLNKARAKRGKHLIPSHAVVHTRDYVTQAIAHTAVATGSNGGHHASPIAHWRRSHLRHLSTGKIVPVRSSKVNWRETEELHRMFYRV